jgi:uracil-DNA glycosylase family 4
MPNYVPGIGPRDAKIVIVGEAPGKDEDEKGEPFVGGAGYELNSLLTSVGLNRQSIYITNVIKYRPPNNDFDVFYLDGKKHRQPSPYLLQAWDYLHAEIRAIQPNVIVPMGNEPIRAVRGSIGMGTISDWRGSILTSPLGKMIPTYHPAYMMRQYSERPVIELDLRRIVQESKYAHVDTPKMHFEIDPPFTRVLEFLRSQPKRVAVDIETSGKHIRCVGIADSATHAICIPFMARPGHVSLGESPFPVQDVLSPTTPNSKWTVQEEYAILQALYAFLGNPNIQKVLQNYPFDSTVLAREFGVHISNLHMDTLVAQHTIHPEMQKGLDFQCSIYTRIPCYWLYDASDDISTWRYNAYDCVATYEISEVHDRQLPSFGVEEFYFNHVQPAMLALTRAQNRGIRVNAAERGGMAVAAEAELARTKEELNKLAGGDLNPNSPPQMQEFLYQRLGLKPQYKFDQKTKERRITCDEDALTKLQRLYPQYATILDFCLTYREKVKLIGTYLTGTLLDGKIYTSYGFATSGRLTSSAPIINPEAGGNLQQIPRGLFRRVFIADEGWVLIKSDLGQADFRVVIWIARVQRLIERLVDPSFDIHRWNAAYNLLSKPENEVTKDERQTSKISVHGSNYGMGPDKAASNKDFIEFFRAHNIQDPLAFCTMMQMRYHRGVPEIRNVYWPETQQLLANNSRVLWTPIGRRRQFFGRWDDDLFRRGYAQVPQAVVGDVINRAFALGDETFDERECHPLLQIHDEIVWHCRKDLVAKYLPRIKNLMEYPVMFHGVEIPLIIPVEITVGSNWASYDPVKNPLGQMEPSKWLALNPQSV